MSQDIIPQAFNFNGHDVRVVMQEQSPWFVAKDVCDVLGYSNASKAIADHVDDDDKLNNESLSSLGQRGGWLINESGLYGLILSSKMTNAREFRRWVTHEVLPSIRKHGGYMVVKADETDDEIMARAILIANQTIQRKQELIEQQRLQLEKEAPKVEAYNDLINAHGLYTLQDTAQLLQNRTGINMGRKRLVDMLIRIKWVFREAGHLTAYQRTVEQGWLCRKGYRTRTDGNGNEIAYAPKVLVTPKGVLKLHNMLLSEPGVAG